MLLLRTFGFWLLLFLQQRVGGRSLTPRGSFKTTDHMRCTWSVRDPGDSVTLRVRCQNPEARLGGGLTDPLKCEYRGRPQSCPAFRSDERHFWKQVSRALKKLGAKMCRNERALVRAGMCRRAPRDAHFQLYVISSVLPSQPAGEPETTTPAPTPRPTSCTGRADHRSTAEEYCSSAWASMCSFLLSMLQTDPC